MLILLITFIGLYIHTEYGISVKHEQDIKQLNFKLDSILSVQDELIIADSLHLDGVRKHYENCAFKLKKGTKFYTE